MKRVLLSLAIVAVCASGALAVTVVDMPVLSPYPTNFCDPEGGSNTFTSTAGSCYIKDETGGGYPMVLGVGAVPKPVLDDTGNNYYIQGKITFNSLSELGFFARGDKDKGQGYAGCINATDGNINLYKFDAFAPVDESPAGFHSTSGHYFGHNEVPKIELNDTYGLGLSVAGSSLRLDVWNADFSSLLTSVYATDSGTPFTSGLVGVCAAQKSGAIEGTWSSMTIPEPGTVAMSLAGALALLGWAGLRRRS